MFKRIKLLPTSYVSAFQGLEEHILRFIRKSPRPEFLEIQLDITNHCNLRCAHCYHPHHDNKGALSQEEWFAVLDAYASLLTKLKRAPSLILCGGEPTTSPLLIPLLTRIRQTFGNCHVSILTNGTTLRPLLVERLAPWKPHFQISFDGANAVSHDAVRGRGRFQLALSGMENLRNAGLPFSVLSILSRRTASELPEFFAWAKSHRIPQLNFVRLVVEGTGKELVARGEDAPLFGQELKSALEQIVSLSRASGVATNTHKPLFALLENGLGSHYRFQSIVVDYRGGLKVSSRTSTVLGHVLLDGLENLYLNHPLLRALRESQIEGCGDCRFLSRCGGDRNAAFAATGNFLARDPGCWLPHSVSKNPPERKIV